MANSRPKTAEELATLSYPARKPITNPQQPKTYAEHIRWAMQTVHNPQRSPITLRQLAELTGRSYEHCRKLAAGEDCGSRSTNDAICEALGLDADAMWRLAEAAKMRRRYGIGLTARVPADDRLINVWSRLNDQGRERLLTIAEGIAAEQETVGRPTDAPASVPSTPVATPSLPTVPEPTFTGATGPQLVPRRVQALLRQRDMKQGDLAKAIGRSGGFVSQFMRGVRGVSPATLDAIAMALRVDVSELVDDPDQAPTHSEVPSMLTKTRDAIDLATMAAASTADVSGAPLADAPTPTVAASRGRVGSPWMTLPEVRDYLGLLTDHATYRWLNRYGMPKAGGGAVRVHRTNIDRILAGLAPQPLSELIQP